MIIFARFVILLFAFTAFVDATISGLSGMTGSFFLFGAITTILLTVMVLLGIYESHEERMRNYREDVWARRDSEGFGS